MAYEVSQPDTFYTELGSAPKKVQNAFRKTVLPQLRSNPTDTGPSIKKLKGFDKVWRFRIGDNYRLVYLVEPDDFSVRLLLIGHRKEIYDRINYEPDSGATSIAIIETPQLLDFEPTPEQVGRANFDVAAAPPEAEHAADQALPVALEKGLLADWGIPSEYHEDLGTCVTEGELLSISGNPIPDWVVERVMNAIWPRKITQIVNLPVRVSTSPDVIPEVVDGEVPLETFLLKLDDDQRPFVERFQIDNPIGPWLLKGGPGSGKSTIALYCIRELLKGPESLLGTQPIKVLFATYTNALKLASKHLLESLDVGDDVHELEISTVDSLAYQIAFRGNSKARSKILSGPALDRFFQEVVFERARKDPEYPFKPQDAQFLLEEIEWVILGRGLSNLESYLGEDRKGRGRQLNRSQREKVWGLFEDLESGLAKRRELMFQQVISMALTGAKPEYDYVFIDEAQDLTPNAIRLCLKLCKDPEHVFLTADRNQSIYGSGFSWASVAKDLRFTGKSRILRRNYRSTAEIWQAIQQITQPLSEVDPETLDEEVVFNGPFPKLQHYEDAADEVRRINEFIHTSLVLERAGPGCAAVLCPSKKAAQWLAKNLAPNLNAQFMPSRELDVGHSGVKVLTMHASKGLDFPVVVVTRVNRGEVPVKVRGGLDPIEHEQQQRRLFFVACSRAMRHLLVLSKKGRESPFVSRLTESHWDMGQN